MVLHGLEVRRVPEGHDQTVESLQGGGGDPQLLGQVVARGGGLGDLRGGADVVLLQLEQVEAQRGVTLRAPGHGVDGAHVALQPSDARVDVDAALRERQLQLAHLGQLVVGGEVPLAVHQAGGEQRVLARAGEPGVGVVGGEDLALRHDVLRAQREHQRKLLRAALPVQPQSRAELLLEDDLLRQHALRIVELRLQLATVAGEPVARRRLLRQLHAQAQHPLVGRREDGGRDPAAAEDEEALQR